MFIRPFQEEDVSQMIQLFHDTVHTVNAKDYSAAQLQVWAPTDDMDTLKNDWAKTFNRNISYIVEIDSVIVGFSDLTEAGYIDRLYVHKDYQRLGIATVLINKLENEARKRKLSKITVDASITAKPFFERHHYKINQSQIVIRKGIELVNYKMTKIL